MRHLYQRLIALSGNRHAPLWLFAVAFAEASFFPLPPDLLLIPMILSRPQRAWWLAGICTAGSVAGGLLGYWIGATLFNQLAAPVVHFYHAEHAYQSFLEIYKRYGFWAILIKGLTPIPFKLVTIASGAAHLDLGKFVLACVITRGGRFFLAEAIPLRLYGDRARVFIDRRLGLVSFGFLLLAILGVVLLRYL